MPNLLPTTTPPNISTSKASEQKHNFTICAMKLTQKTLQVNRILSPRVRQLDEVISPSSGLVIRLFSVETELQNWSTRDLKPVRRVLKLLFWLRMLERESDMPWNRFSRESRQAIKVGPYRAIYLYASGNPCRICTYREVKSLTDQLLAKLIDNFQLKDMQVTLLVLRVVPGLKPAAQTIWVGLVHRELSHTHTSLLPVGTPPPWKVYKFKLLMAQLGLSSVVTAGLKSTSCPNRYLLTMVIQLEILPVEMVVSAYQLLSWLVQAQQVWMLVKRVVTVSISWAMLNFCRELPLPNRQASSRPKAFWLQALLRREYCACVLSITLKQLQKVQPTLPSENTTKVTAIMPMQLSPNIVHPRCTMRRQISKSKMCVETRPNRIRRLPVSAKANTPWKTPRPVLKYLVKQAVANELYSVDMTPSWQMYISSIFWLLAELLRMVFIDPVRICAEAWMSQAWLDSLAVVRNPLSMSVSIALAVALGPRPFLINKESIIGVLCPALAAVAVVVGLGVNIWESLQLEQMLRLACRIDTIVSCNQESPGKQICIFVTADASRLVMLPIWLRRFTKPPQVPSPLRAESIARQMLQEVSERFLFMAGMNENEMRQVTSTPIEKIKVSTMTTRNSGLVQGLTLQSLRRHSQGGQLLSKRHKMTIAMNTAMKRTPKIRQGIISSLMYAPRSAVFPVITIDYTRFIEV